MAIAIHLPSITGCVAVKSTELTGLATIVSDWAGGTHGDYINKLMFFA